MLFTQKYIKSYSRICAQLLKKLYWHFLRKINDGMALFRIGQFSNRQTSKRCGYFIFAKCTVMDYTGNSENQFPIFVNSGFLTKKITLPMLAGRVYI